MSLTLYTFTHTPHYIHIHYSFRRASANPEAEAMEILAQLVLNHVPVDNYCFRSKVCLCFMRCIYEHGMCATRQYIYR